MYLQLQDERADAGLHVNECNLWRSNALNIAHLLPLVCCQNVIYTDYSAQVGPNCIRIELCDCINIAVCEGVQKSSQTRIIFIV